MGFKEGISRGGGRGEMVPNHISESVFSDPRTQRHAVPVSLHGRAWHSVSPMFYLARHGSVIADLWSFLLSGRAHSHHLL